MRYLLAVFLVFSSMAHAQQRGEWFYKSKVDGFTDQESHIAVVVVREDVMTNAFMTVRCINGELAALVSLDKFLDSDDDVRVRYRFDDGEVQTGEWAISTQGDTVFAPDPAAFARQLIPAASLLFEARDYQGTPHSTRFPMKGSQKAVEPVLAACQ